MPRATSALVPTAFAGLLLALAACAPQPPLIPTTPLASEQAAATPSASPSAPASATPSAPTLVVRHWDADLPPWGAPTDTEARILAAGLKADATEHLAYHIHAHLDVFANGTPVTVPANIGIDAHGAFISALHTHSTDGVMHIEAPAEAKLTLGQFFTEWGVSLDGAKVWVNGTLAAEPAAIVLAANQEVAVAYGTPPAEVPQAWGPTAP